MIYDLMDACILYHVHIRQAIMIDTLRNTSQFILCVSISDMSWLQTSIDALKVRGVRTRTGRPSAPMLSAMLGRQLRGVVHWCRVDVSETEKSTFRDDVISHLLDLFMGNSQGFCRRQTSLFVIEININFITHLLIRHTSWHVLFSPTAMREKGGWAPLEMLGASILHQVSLDEFVGRGSGFLALVPYGCPRVVALIFTHCTRLRIAVITDSEGPRHWWTWCFWVFVKRRPL